MTLDPSSKILQSIDIFGWQSTLLVGLLTSLEFYYFLLILFIYILVKNHAYIFFEIYDSYWGNPTIEIKIIASL